VKALIVIVLADRSELGTPLLRMEFPTKRTLKLLLPHQRYEFHGETLDRSAVTQGNAIDLVEGE
jgi:hypothetical protein